MKKIQIKHECKACEGTGVYVGFAEKDGAAVVCSRCKGTGEIEFIYHYNDFTGRKKREGVKTIFEANPGIGIGNGDNCKLEDFGGMPYEDWNDGKSFPEKSEMRKYTCPAWWSQSSPIVEKVELKKCEWGRFSECEHFINKELCWDEYDKIKEKGNTK